MEIKKTQKQLIRRTVSGIMALLMVFSANGMGNGNFNTVIKPITASAEGGTLNQLDGVYQIASANDLLAFADIANGTNGADQNQFAEAVLTADIDLAGIDWTPIGLYTDASDVGSKGNFRGTFDGNGHVIKNLTITRNDSYEVGLFGRIQKATIQNLGIVNATVTGNKGVRCGVLGGEIYESTVENCFTAGTITITTTNDQKGGIAGKGASSTFKNCYTTYDVVVNEAYSVQNCYSSADYQADDLTSGALAYKLNENTTTDSSIWKQNLGTDEYPVPDSSHSLVYVGYSANSCIANVYANTLNTTPTHTYDHACSETCSVCGARNPEPAEHNWKSDTCTVCGKLKSQIVGAFKVSGGVNGTDYEYNETDKLLTIKTSTELTIKNSNPDMATDNCILVAKEVSANITLAGVNIDVSNNYGQAALCIEDDSTGNVTITLAEGTVNTLKSGPSRVFIIFSEIGFCFISCIPLRKPS